jgi:tetratricopeptide (TPR) repeat protein
MTRIEYCPVIGGSCNKPETLTSIQMNTFFLAEPFKPEKQRKRREQAIRNALKEILVEQFSDSSLRVVDKEPNEPAIFCDICRMIQSSSYGIADISGLNPNVLLELGMMFASGKPVFVLVKRSEQENLRRMLPSDIIWKRVIVYEECIDIEEELSQVLKHRPEVKPEITLASEVKRVITALNPAFADRLDAKLCKLEKEQGQVLAKLEKLLSHGKSDEIISNKSGLLVNPEIESVVERTYEEGVSFKEMFSKELGGPWLFVEGLHYIIKKDYDKGLALLEKALEMDPEDKDILLVTAYYCTALERYPRAMECYRKILRKDKSINRLQNYSELLICAGECENGLRIAKRALRSSKIAEDKILSTFLVICAYSFMGNGEQAKHETSGLIDYIGTLTTDTGFSIKRWEFGTICRSIEKKLDGIEKERLLSLCTVLSGEIGIKGYLEKYPK